MQVKFPWYKQMHNLLHGSPVFNTSALANSATSLDTSVLMNEKHGNRQSSPDWDDAAIDASFKSGHDVDDSKSVTSDVEPPHELPANLPPATATSKASPLSQSSSLPSLDSSTSATPRGSKRKDPFQKIQDETALYAKSRMDSERLRADTKRQCLETELTIQRLKNEEQERQRQHELQLIDKQILLAQLQASNTKGQSSNTNAMFIQGSSADGHFGGQMW